MEIFTNADAIVISSSSIVYSIVIFSISNFNIFINIVKFALSTATSNATSNAKFAEYFHYF